MMVDLMDTCANLGYQTENWQSRTSREASCGKSGTSTGLSSERVMVAKGREVHLCLQPRLAFLRSYSLDLELFHRAVFNIPSLHTT
jgi:hypothetical protein